jgi:hypothetical protein
LLLNLEDFRIYNLFCKCGNRKAQRVGIKIKYNIMARMIECSRCEGSGDCQKCNNGDGVCKKCGGDGEVWFHPLSHGNKKLVTVLVDLVI